MFYLRPFSDNADDEYNVTARYCNQASAHTVTRDNYANPQ